MDNKGYRNLLVWQKAVDNVESIYLLTKKFPKEETLGLTSQIRRASSSIPANIAEGSARKSRKEFNRFLNIAYGSLAELETHLIVSERVGFISKTELETNLKNCDTIAKMTSGLIKSLKTHI